MTFAVLDSYRFPANSRYTDTPLLTLTAPDGSQLRYLERRFLPDPAAFVSVRRRTIDEGDRLDAIAGAEIGDPELWWRLADANRALDPAALVAPPARGLTIPLPLGIPGGPGV